MHVPNSKLNIHSFNIWIVGVISTEKFHCVRQLFFMCFPFNSCALYIYAKGKLHKNNALWCTELKYHQSRLVVVIYFIAFFSTCFFFFLKIKSTTVFRRAKEWEEKTIFFLSSFFLCSYFFMTWFGRGYVVVYFLCSTAIPHFSTLFPPMKHGNIVFALSPRCGVMYYFVSSLEIWTFIEHHMVGGDFLE